MTRQPAIRLFESPMFRVSLGIGSLLLAASAAWGAVALLQAGPRADGTGVTPEGWRITPAGRQIALGPGPLAVATTPDGALVLVERAGYDRHALLVLDARSGKLLQQFDGAADGSSGFYLGLTVSRDGRFAFASDGAGSAVRSYRIANRRLEEEPALALPAGAWPAGIEVSKRASHLYVAGNLSDSLYVIDLATRSVVHSVPVGHLPYGVAVSDDGERVYVSNWGERSVTVVNPNTGRATSTIAVGTHPSALARNPKNDELYVANSDSDSISVVDTRGSRVLRTIDLRAFRGAPVGASPNALAVSPDGDTLYVANAGSNALAVIDLADRGQGSDRSLGLVPTGWFPSAVALHPTGKTLYVTNMKGVGIGPIAPDQYIADQLRGTLSIVPVPSRDQLREYTRTVWQNVRLPDEGTERGRSASNDIVPRTAGEKSPIKHVIYVLKENRTYDQVLGDLGRGNGDPSLTLFGEAITPNQHELARRFVTFDNFYANGEVSADGWTWANAASANTYNQKNWPLDYGSAGRLYDFGGFGNAETAAFPGEVTLQAFFWDHLARRGISYRNYGFFVNGAPVVVDESMPGLQGQTDLGYPGWDMGVPDQVRIDRWLTDFRRFEAAREMPTVQFVYLPRDHTEGTWPGVETPRAMVADNDLALGRLVEAVSHSCFWDSTAIFVTEDDAQDGADHVDGHRTLAFVVSPYTQHGKIDSTFYSTVSMLRTMELIVGVEPMTQFDALATPMRAAFSARPERRPYRARIPAVSLTELNPEEAPLAEESARLDFSSPDSADHRMLNLAIWKSVKGPASDPPRALLARSTVPARASGD